MEFMGIAVGILALICALVLLFGRHGTRKILGWSLGLVILGTAGVVAAVWAIDHNRQARPLSDAEVGLAPNNTATAPPFDPSKPYEVIRPAARAQTSPWPQTSGGVTYAPKNSGVLLSPNSLKDLVPNDARLR
jgi:hypothetical protein